MNYIKELIKIILLVKYLLIKLDVLFRIELFWKKNLLEILEKI